jgi:hypothetical protein
MLGLKEINKKRLKESAIFFITVPEQIIDERWGNDNESAELILGGPSQNLEHLFQATELYMFTTMMN